MLISPLILFYSHLLQANVICIVYSVNNKKSIEKVGVIFKKNYLILFSSFLVLVIPLQR